MAYEIWQMLSIRMNCGPMNASCYCRMLFKMAQCTFCMDFHGVSATQQQQQQQAGSKILFSFDLLQIAVARHKASELGMTSYISESSVLSPHDSTTV